MLWFTAVLEEKLTKQTVQLIKVTETLYTKSTLTWRKLLTRSRLCVRVTDFKFCCSPCLRRPRWHLRFASLRLSECCWMKRLNEIIGQPDWQREQRPLLAMRKDAWLKSAFYIQTEVKSHKVEQMCILFSGKQGALCVAANPSVPVGKGSSALILVNTFPMR